MRRGVAGIVTGVVASGALIVLAAQPPGTLSSVSPGAAPAEVPPPGYPEQPAGVPFPTAEWSTGPLPAGVDGGLIDAAVLRAFGAPDAASRVQSVVVVHGGRIVYEQYHPLDGPDKQYNSFSVAKSFASALIGLLVADGMLELDAPPGVDEWGGAGDPRQAITLRQLLQMSSGLQWTEDYSADYHELIDGSSVTEAAVAPNAAEFVAQRPLESPPGTIFEYSTGTTMLLSGIAASALGGCQQVKDYLDVRLFDPIGITTETLQSDAGGCWYGGFGANMSARDFARFGLLYLRGGWWDGETVIPVAWVDESRKPAPTFAGYGLHWWIDSPEVFFARGLFGQLIVVAPGQDLVIVVNSTSNGDPYSVEQATGSRRSHRLAREVLAAFGIGESPPEETLPPTR